MTLGTSILGTHVARIEDPRFLTGAGTYIGGLDLPGAVSLAFVRSTVAHARLVGVDVDEARRAPGVVAVLTAADLTGLAPVGPIVPAVDARFSRPYLAEGVVRFVGEPIAVVVAETAVQADDAADLVVVDLDPLPAVVGVDEALRDDVVVFPEVGTNVAVASRAKNADVDLFAGCDVVVEARLVNQRMAVAPMEARAAAARWDGERLTQWACSQGAHWVRSSLADVLGLANEQVRVIVPDVGGGFGGKSGTSPEELLVGWLARHLDRPVRWFEHRSEHMRSFNHARGQVQHVRLGGTRDGRLLAYELHIIQDCGAYPVGYGAMMPRITGSMATGCYAIERLRNSSVGVVTTTTPVGSFRGAGRPEAAAAIERMVDLFASRVGLDPVEVRRRNLLAPDAFPYTTPSGASYDSGAYEAALDRALAAAGYDELRAEQRRRRDAGDRRLLGIGIASYVEITNPTGGGEFGAVTLDGDGGATIRTGSSSHGQGHATAWTMLVHDATGIPMDRIRFIYGDTDLVPRGMGTGGSKSLQVGGMAVRIAAEQLVDEARQRVADRLEANPDDVVLDATSGRFHVVGTPAVGMSWPDLADAADEPLAVELDFKPGGATFPFGAHVAVVEVDADTGGVTLQRFVACDDAGRIMNPLLFEGQVHGGLASGVAQAMFEAIDFDADGNPLTTTFADYAIVSAPELPSFELVTQETPTPRNPLGVKGVGEAGTIGATPAVQNAVVDALAHLGVEHLDLPLTPERVWQAIRTAEGRRPDGP